MTRFTQIALFALVALSALFSVVRADEEVQIDGKTVKVFDSGVGDQDYAKGAGESHDSFKFLAGKTNHRMAINRVKHYTVKPDATDKFWKDNIKITWYASNDLKAPACGDGTWDPENSSHIGATSVGWTNGPKCGEFVRLCNSKVSRCVHVRIVDQCAGCNDDHVDLTKSAFQKLATTGSLEEGITTHLKMYRSEVPDLWDKALFGPVKLRN
ncbi:hypothetical protein MCUN1_001296 [Malassezia cuniculi]|uniref:RlpA-like protein double-psi beta-barrel domain-containing protein n=1 Tax=Malassezia cuniculi TaxID=948313 RepID=A0AAF0J5V8_9BASI|nr:hypothetical protein MCUN1_001296 [Malassezia cuniculi]